MTIKIHRNKDSEEIQRILETNVINGINEWGVTAMEMLGIVETIAAQLRVFIHQHGRSFRFGNENDMDKPNE